MPWQCHGTAKHCHGIAIALPWPCHGMRVGQGAYRHRRGEGKMHSGTIGVGGVCTARVGGPAGNMHTVTAGGVVVGYCGIALWSRGVHRDT